MEPYRYRYDDAKPRPRYTIAELVACIEREIAIRKRVYPNHVETRRYSVLKADREIACMVQIAEHLRALAKTERLL